MVFDLPQLCSLGGTRSNHRRYLFTISCWPYYIVDKFHQPTGQPQ